MAAYGKVKAFNPKTDEWEVYEEQLRFYMVANGIDDGAKKCSILLTVCGDQTFKLLRSLVPDGKLDADGITYDSLVELLKSHFKKKQSVVVHRFNINTRLRKPSESIADYIAALRELAMNCNFGSKELLEEMLRDRLVCGVNHSGIQRKLLSEGDISYKDGPRAVDRVSRGRRQEARWFYYTCTTTCQLHFAKIELSSPFRYVLPLWRSALGSSLPPHK